MRFLTADYIFPISSPPIKNGVVIVNDNGIIEELLTEQQFQQQQETANKKLQAFTGIICPGFINAHCHLELSHLKGKFTEGKGLPNFIGEVVSKRQADKEQIQAAINAAEDEMIANGIVAVGDICNTTDTIFQKKKNRLKYHNFIEIFDLHPDNADKEFEKGVALMKEFEVLDQQCSLTPHAPYTVSTALLKKINKWASANNAVLTIHNQETETENEMFRSRTGALFQKLSSFGNLYTDWQATGSNSLLYTLKYLSNNKLLLVHNTYTSKKDIQVANRQLPTANFLFFSFCPNTNLFIENRLPDFKIFIEENCNIVVGTDSYASNWSLSIIDELKTISKHDPSIPLNDLLKWATLNGAEFFGWQKELGSIEKGKRPRLSLITDVDFNTLTLTKESRVRPL